MGDSALHSFTHAGRREVRIACMMRRGVAALQMAAGPVLEVLDRAPVALDRWQRTLHGCWIESSIAGEARMKVVALVRQVFVQHGIRLCGIAVEPHKVYLRRATPIKCERSRLGARCVAAAAKLCVCSCAVCSGGKDSCYNMVLCQKYGHEVGAQPRPLPPDPEPPVTAHRPTQPLLGAGGCAGQPAAPASADR